MFGIGLGELLIVALIGIVFLGPDRCVALAKKVGSKLNDIQREWNGMTE